LSTLKQSPDPVSYTPQMSIDQYYSEDPTGIHISRQQASAFAKHVADDFNPLHNLDAKLFCVPGDLLFALVLSRYGVSQRMRFTFLGMVGDDVALQLPDLAEQQLVITDAEGKQYLNVEREGQCSSDPQLIQGLTSRYVQFSGRTFPHILVPLMSEHGIMINPARPLVIYESMEIDLDHLEIPAPELEFTRSLLEVNGKRGRVRLEFTLKVADEIVGRGAKYMSLRGLRPFDQETVDQMVKAYTDHKQAYIG